MEAISRQKMVISGEDQMEVTSSLEVFKMRLNRVLDYFIEASFPTKCWIRRSFEVPSDLDCSVIL